MLLFSPSGHRASETKLCLEGETRAGLQVYKTGPSSQMVHR